MPRLILLLPQLLLDNHLRGNARMVKARTPQRLPATHPIPARQTILDGAHERVAQVQRARHIRRRHRHHKLLAIRGCLAKVLLGALGLEEAQRLPPLVPRRLDIQRTVGVRQRTGRVLLLTWEKTFEMEA